MLNRKEDNTVSCTVKNNPEVTVVTPTYERPKDLLRSICSVLDQSFTNFELFVINDGSPESLDYVRKNVDDDRVRYFPNERAKGGNGARNTGICKARGDFIAFLDDDDEWLPDKLNLQVSRLKNLDESWGGVYGPFEVLRRGTWVCRNAEREGEFLASLLDSSAPVCAGSTLMVRKSIFKNIGLFDETLKRQQDLELLCRFFEKYKLATVNNTIAKIYGHNPPEPYYAEAAKHEFFAKIERQIKMLSAKEKARVYAHHFRELSLLFAWRKKPNKTFEYMLKSSQADGFHIKNTLSPLLHLALSYISVNYKK